MTGNARSREGAQFSRLFHITAATNMLLLVKYGKIYRHYTFSIKNIFYDKVDLDFFIFM